MNMKKRILAIPAATTKTPVYPTIAAMMAMARNINAHANIVFSPLLNFLALRLVDESSSRKLGAKNQLMRNVSVNLYSFYTHCA